MKKTSSLGPRPKRIVSDFAVGKPVYWFDGVEDSKSPKLVELEVSSVHIGSDSVLKIVAGPSGIVAETSLCDLYLEKELSNWVHVVNGVGVRYFLFTNPFFLTDREVVWLSSVAKAKDYRDHLIVFMSDVDIGVSRGKNLEQYGIAMHNWMLFWRARKRNAPT